MAGHLGNCLLDCQIPYPCQQCSRNDEPKHQLTLGYKFSPRDLSETIVFLWQWVYFP